MTALAAHLRALDDAWAHAWESLAAVLDGIEDEEAYWQAPCYADDPPEEGWPAPGTVAWQIAHLAHCKRHYAAIVRERARAQAPQAAPRSALANLAAERAALEAAHAEQRAALAAVPDGEDLERRACGKLPLGEFVTMNIRHDTWHAAQIAVARRLYRTRGE